MVTIHPQSHRNTTLVVAGGDWREASTPSAARLPPKNPPVSSGWECKYPFAASLALVASVVPAGCGFQLTGWSAVWMNTIRI